MDSNLFVTLLHFNIKLVKSREESFDWIILNRYSKQEFCIDNDEFKLFYYGHVSKQLLIFWLPKVCYQRKSKNIFLVLLVSLLLAKFAILVIFAG